MMWPWMWGGWGWMGFGMIFFWLLIIAGAYFLFTGFAWPRRRYRYDALEIARERYARGEITLEEFEEIKRNLT